MFELEVISYIYIGGIWLDVIRFDTTTIPGFVSIQEQTKNNEINLRMMGRL